MPHTALRRETQPYLVALRPIVVDAVAARGSWVPRLVALARGGPPRDIGRVATVHARRFGRASSALAVLEPPPVCANLDAALAAWLQALEATCVPLAGNARPKLEDIDAATSRLRDVAAAAERFNSERARLPALLDAVPVLERQLPVRRNVLVGAAALLALMLILRPSAAVSQMVPPTATPLPTATATPAPPIKLRFRRTFSETFLLTTLKIASAAQALPLQDLDLKVQGPSRVLVSGTVTSIAVPARVDVDLRVGTSTAHRPMLEVVGFGARGGTLPTGFREALVRRIDELNVRLAEQIPSGQNVRFAYVEGDKVVLEIEDA